MASLAAAALVLGLAGTALAADPVYATVTGYAPATEDNNHPETWGDNCETAAGVSGVDSWVLPALGAGEEYSLVVVKAGSESSDGNNTLFENPSAGETVWADSNENGIFDVGGQDGDKQISHVIVCTGAAEGDNASLNIRKEDEGGNPLAGAVFTVEGMEGTFTTGENGKFCITGLAEDSQWLVTEIQAPPGYQLADPASQLVEVDNDGDCDSPSATFVNLLSEATPAPTPEQTPAGATPEQTPAQTPEGSVAGGTGTPAPSQPDTAMGAQGGPSPIPTIAFALILVAALGTLAWANVKSARSRA